MNTDAASQRFSLVLSALGWAGLCLGFSALFWEPSRGMGLGLLAGLLYGFSFVGVLRKIVAGKRSRLQWLILSKTLVLFVLLYGLSSWGVASLLAFPPGFCLVVLDLVLKNSKKKAKAAH